MPVAVVSCTFPPAPYEITIESRPPNQADGSGGQKGTNRKGTFQVAAVSYSEHRATLEILSILEISGCHFASRVFPALYL